jgi:hypothetical protein
LALLPKRYACTACTGFVSPSTTTTMPKDYCCCAIPLVNTGIYLTIFIQFVVAFVAGILSVSTPSSEFLRHTTEVHNSTSVKSLEQQLRRSHPGFWLSYVLLALQFKFLVRLA